MAEFTERMLKRATNTELQTLIDKGSGKLGIEDAIFAEAENRGIIRSTPSMAEEAEPKPTSISVIPAPIKLPGIPGPLGTGVPDFAFKRFENINFAFQEQAPLVEDGLNEPLTTSGNKFILSALSGLTPEDLDLPYAMKNMQDQDKSEQAQKNLANATSKLQDNTILPSIRLAIAKELANAPVFSRLPALIYTDKVFSEVQKTQDQPENLAKNKQDFANRIDLALGDEENKTLQARLISDNPKAEWDTVINTASDAAKKIFEELVKDLKASGGELFETLVKANPLLIEQALSLSEQVSPKNLLNVGTETSVTSYKDLIEFVSIVPYEKSMDVDWGKFWDELTDGDSQFISDQWKEAMASQYGPDWKARFIAFTTKEIGVDAALLTAAAIYPPVGRIIAPGATASIGRKLSAVAARALLFGVGGGAAQSALNMSIGEHPNFGFEFALRAGASLAGDSLIGAVKLGIKAGKGFTDAIFGELSALKSKGIAVREQSNLERLFDVTDNQPPIADAVLKASLYAEIKEYNRLGQIIGEYGNNTLDAARKADLGKHISKLTGIPADQLETRLAADASIFKELELPLTSTLTPEGQRLQIRFDAKQVLISKLKTRVARLKETLADKGETPRRLTNIKKAQELLRQEQIKLRKLRAERDSEFFDSTGNAQADIIMQDAQNGIEASRAFGYRYMGEAMNIEDMFMTNIRGLEYTPRDPAYSGAGLSAFGKVIAPFRKFTHTTDPRQLPAPEITTGFFDAVNLTNAFSANFKEVFDTLYPTVGKIKKIDGQITTAKDRINLAIAKGSEEQRVWTDVELSSLFAMDQKDIASYYKIRWALDQLHIIMDQAKVQSLKTHKIQGLDKYQKYQGEVVEILKLDKQAGEAEVFYVKRTGAFPSRRKTVSLAELNPIHSVLDYHVGYSPIVYDSVPHRVTIGKIKDKTAVMEAAFPTRVEAIQYARKRQEELGKTGMAIYHTFDERIQMGQVGFPKSSYKLMDIVPGDEAKVIREALEKAGVPEDQVRLTLDMFGPESLRGHHIGRRAESRLKTTGGKEAPMLPADQAIVELFQTVANLKGVGVWRAYAKEQFDTRFAKVLNKSVNWTDDKYIQATNPADKPLAEQAKIMQRWLKRTVLGRTSAERYVENFYLSTGEKIDLAAADGKKWAVGLNWYLDNYYPRLLTALVGSTIHPGSLALVLPKNIFKIGSKEANNIYRGIASTSKLMMGNVGQLFVQGSQILITAGVRPIHAQMTLRDLALIHGALVFETASSVAGRKVVSGFDKEGQHLMAILRRSGWFDEVSITDLMETVSRYNVPILKGVGDGLKRLSEAPFRSAEKLNRIMAFLAARRELISKIKEGKEIISPYTNKAFRGAIDNDEFIKIANDMGAQTALDMGRAGQIELFSGHGSVVFQFFQVFLKQLGVFETKALTVPQKFGAAAAVTGFWGAAGIPGVLGMFEFADWTLSAITGQPSKRLFFQDMAKQNREKFAQSLEDLTPQEALDWGIDAEFYDRLMRKGAIHALTDGEWDIVNRVALGRFVSEKFEMSGDPLDFIVSVGVIRDIIEAGQALETQGLLSLPAFLELSYALATSDQRYRELFLEIYGVTPKNAFVSVLRETGRAVSSFGHLGRFLDNVDGKFLLFNFNRAEHDPAFAQQKEMDRTIPNFFTTSRRQTTGVQVSEDRLVQELFGITPGKVVKFHESKALDRIMVEAFNNYRKSQYDKYDAAEGNWKIQSGIINETLKEIDRLRPVLESNNLKGGLTENYFSQTIKGFITRSLRLHKLPDIKRRAE